MNLSTQIQTIRRLKPFMEAISALVEMADILNGAEQRVASLQAAEVQTKQALDSARADVESARSFAAEHVVIAKTQAVAITKRAEEFLAGAKTDADNIRASAKGDAQATVNRAASEVAKLDTEAVTLAEAIKAKVEECARLDKKISEARDTLRKIAAV